MKTSKMLFLSYVLDKNTPTYGNRNIFSIEKKADMSKGDVANDSSIETTAHIGTHIDMPYHFYENGQTIEDFSANFWIFDKVLFVEIEPKDFVIKDELIEKLRHVEDKESYELLLVKTAICDKRTEDIFWEKNPGFSPDLAAYLREYFPNVRVLGFDSISVSSFAERMIGREAHKTFLNPTKPILLLEDMDLRSLDESIHFQQVIIAPTRIANCDGLPCTILARVGI